MTKVLSNGIYFGLAVLVSLSLAGCGADSPGDSDEDVMSDAMTETDSTQDTDPDQGDCTDDISVQTENPDPMQEFSDCFAGCGHSPDPPVVNLSPDQAVRGVIDGECHQFDNGQGPDIDIFGITAPVRTMVEVIVEPAACSAIDPLVISHSGGFPMTFNDNAESGGKTARTVFAAPTVNAVPMFIIVNDAQNYEDFVADQFYDSCDQFNGGDDFGYLVKVNESPWMPTTLGDLAGGSLTGSGALTRGGDIVYFTFTGPADAQPTVTVTSTGSSEFLPTLVPMKTAQGEMVWQSVSYDEDGDGTHFINGGFRACDSDCAGQNAEFAFAVLDWNGAPGNFTFDVQVSM